MFVILLGLLYFDYYSFVVNIEVRKCETSNMIVLQDYLDYSQSSLDFIKIWGCIFISVKNITGILSEIVLNMYVYQFG